MAKGIDISGSNDINQFWYRLNLQFNTEDITSILEIHATPI